MTGEHHDLVHEFPEYREQIHNLKMTNKHFAKLFEEYHTINNNVELMEGEVTPTATDVEEGYKKRRLQLKDELHTMLKAFADE